MATLDELNILLGADTSNLERGLSKGSASVSQFAANAAAAGGSTEAAMRGMGKAATEASGLYVDAAGRMRSASGRFASEAEKAAAGAASFGNAATKAAGGLDRMAAAGEKVQSVGNALSVGVTLPIVGAGTAALVAAGNVEALENGLKAVVEQTLRAKNPLVSQQQILAESAKQFAELNEVAKLPGLGLTEVVRGAINLETIGFSAAKAQKSITSFGNAIATVGKGREEFSRAINGLQQLANTDFPLGEDLNIIKEAIPQVTPLLKEAFGTARTEDLKKLGITSAQVVDAIVNGLAKLPPVAGGINNAFENASDGITKSAGLIGASLNKSFGVENLLNRFTDTITGLAEGFARLDPSTQKVVFSLAAAAAAVGPLVVGIGSLGAAIPAIVAGFGTVGAAVGLAAGPLALVVAGVAGAAVAIIANWDDIVSYFQGPDGQIFRELARTVSESIDLIKSGFSDLNNSANFGDLISASEAVTNTIQEIGTGFTAVLDVVNGVVRTVSALLGGEWARAWDGAKQVVLGVAAPVARILGYDYAGLREKLNVLGDGPFGGASVKTDNMFAILTRGALGFLPAAEQTVVALNAVKKAASAPDTGLSDNQQKALDKFLQAVKTTETLSKALGDSYDFIGERQKVFEQGLKSLADVGFTAAQLGARGYSQELKLLNGLLTEADRLKNVVPKTVGEVPKTLLPERVEVPNLGVAIAGFNAKALGASVDEARKHYLSLTDAQKAAFQNTLAFNVGLEETFGSLSDVIAGASQSIASSIGGAFGEGASLIAVAGGAVVKALAEVAGKYGGLLIKLGAANLTIPGAQGLGVAQIAGGIALVAAAGIASAAGSTLLSGGRGISPANIQAGPSSTLGTRSSRIEAQKLNINVKFEPVSLRADGPQLRAVLAVDEYRLSRTS